MNMNYYYLVYPLNGERFIGFSESGAIYKKGDKVIAETIFGKDVVHIFAQISEEEYNKGAQDEQKCSKIFRVAEKSEIDFTYNNRDEIKKCLERAKEIASELKMDIRIFKVHFLPLSTDAVFFFISEKRVDFRELVSRLVREFKMHVILRQVTARDEARFYDICGQCGRPLCCRNSRRQSDNIQLNTKITKAQVASINPNKHFGLCGKLFCCFSYEEEFYKNMLSSCPKAGDDVYFQNSVLKIRDVNYITGEIHLDSKSENVSPYRKFKLNHIEKKDDKWVINENDLEENR